MPTGTGFRCSVLLLALAGQGLAHDWLIVPGKRVGPVTAASTEMDVRASFGGAVRQTQIRIGATTAPGLEIYPGKAGDGVWIRSDDRDLPKLKCIALW